jgi:hypothetical protein
MDTLLLTEQWDLSVTSGGDIAVASDPYSQAQDAASAIKTFQGEAYYDTTLGVPYWQNILGRLPPLSLVRSLIAAAALTVPGVTAAVVTIASVVNRTLSGRVSLTTSDGSTTTVPF